LSSAYHREPPSFPTRRSSDLATAHLGQVAVELLHLGNHRLRNLEALFRDVKAVPHRAPHGIVTLFDADVVAEEGLAVLRRTVQQDRKSTRLNSSHVAISYADF